ncbi:MAG: ABC transporter substrate-binding protein [Nitrospira sp.]|nr:ABC transporter substrate-binding protein [Nitrospira sp.]
MTSTASPNRTELSFPVRFRLRTALVFASLLWMPSSYLEAAGLEITILKSSDLKAYNEAIDGFKATSPGSAIFAEYDLLGDLERGKQLAKRIRTSESSLVVAVGLKAALAAKLEIDHIPILYMMILDPIKHHLTAGNMTGVLLEIPSDRQFKMMRSFFPALHRIGMLYDPEKTLNKLKEAELRGPVHDFQMQGFPVTNEKDIPQQLRTLLSESDALWLVPDPTVLTDESVRFILESAIARHVPVIAFSTEFTRLGALLSLSVDYGEVGRETGRLAKRILNGEPMMTLKPVSVQRVRISVNLKTARYLGITIPKDVEHLIDETY